MDWIFEKEIFFRISKLLSIKFKAIYWIVSILMNSTPLLSKLLADSGVVITKHGETLQVAMKQEPSKVVRKMVSLIKLLNKLEINDVSVQIDYVLNNSDDVYVVS